ncbi:hypothetical protein ACFE04_021940 [Oxalis oulophora]
MDDFGNQTSQFGTTITTSTNTTTATSVFDASQYAFFGEDVGEEVELGGLDDEEDDDDHDLPVAEADEEEFLFDKQQGGVIRSASDMEDLATTFSKLNKVVNDPRAMGIIGDGRSRENSSAAEWVQEEDFPSWLDQQILDTESLSDGKLWSSQSLSSTAALPELMHMQRTSSYPGKQQPQPPQQPRPHHQLQHYASEPILIPNSARTSYPPPGVRSPQASPNNHYASGGPQIGLPSHNLSPLSNSPIQVAALHQGSPYGGHMHRFPPGMSVNNQPPPNQWVNQPNLYQGDRPNLMNNMFQNGSVPPPQFMGQQQHRPNHMVQPQSYGGHGMPSQLFNPQFSPSPSLLNKMEPMHGMGDIRERPRSAQRGRQMVQFRSMYMTSYELEGILRMQLAATHSNDPYVDDYYHQACLARKSTGAKLKHHFCPTHLRDLPPHARANNEPHAFLQVEALGRVPFSSIRRPRPLLEVDLPNSSGSSNTEQKVSEKPLEQEPMLAARVAIEDALCLLLDVDDIDRFLDFNQMQDCTQLRLKRRSLLEGLATSLHLVDPFSVTGIAPQDDLVFLRIVSLPKGRKLLGKYIKLLFPYPDLMRIVCMAIFRHLRFLFGVLPSDTGLSAATDNLVKIITICVHRMDLGSLSACLAAVVCSQEKPPLRPIGSPAGDGASTLLKSILDRATQVLTDPHTASNYNMKNRSLWQASFDEFFSLLTKHCINKYDSITQALVIQSQSNAAVSGPEALKAIGREMPVELLHSSLPHTNELQKKDLQDFVSRSMPMAGHSSHDGRSGGQLNSESVLS